MASQPMSRPGLMLHPSLPTIKETTLSWLESELESSLFSTNGRPMTDNEPNQISTANVQRYIDFDEQCLSLKSGEGSTSDFSGIQPLPVGSDDTPPMPVNDFNRVVRMDFNSLLTESQNRPKPVIHSDVDGDSGAGDELAEIEPEFQNDGAHNHQDLLNQQEQIAKNITPSDFEALIGMLDNKMIEGDIGNLVGSGDNPAMERLQLIRLWQLMQQEELRRRQEAELAMLNAQRQRMQIDRQESRNLGLEKVDSNHEFGDIGNENLDEIESGDLESNFGEDVLIGRKESVEDAEYLGRFSIETNNQKLDLSQEAFDEMPVEGEKKSFEQLLEEELRKEVETKKHENKSKGPIKRPFLKKGQGLARFDGPPVRKPTKPRKDTKLSNKAPKQDIFQKVKGQKDKQIDTVVSKKPPTNISKTKTQKSEIQNKKIFQKLKPPIQKLQLKPETSLQSTCQEYGYYEAMNMKPAGDIDLEEFEMLERYAEDDASFFNEPSLIVSVLQHEREVDESVNKEDNRLSLRERVRERRKLREEARDKLQDATKQFHVSNQNYSAPVNTGLDLQYLDENNHMEDDEILSPEPPKPYFKSPEKQKAKAIQRKTASLVNKKEKLVRPIAQSAVFSPIKNRQTVASSNPVFADLQSSPHSAFSPHQHFTSKEANSGEEKGYQGSGFQDEQTWGEIDISVLNLSLPPAGSDNEEEEKKVVNDSSRKYKCSDYMEPENEEIENPVRDTDEVRSSVNAITLSPPPPPTMLMQKLFPGLKVPKSSMSSQENSAPKDVKEQSLKDEESSGDSSDNQASILKQKLQELESEILKFKKENTTLENLRKKQEGDLKILGKEMDEFRKQKEDELARLEEYKKTETKRLKKERKLFEEHVLATRMMPRKEEREEIQKLQEELDGLRSDNKAKEQRWVSANNRMRTQVERSQNENEELKERIKDIEAQRVKEWNAQKNNRPKPPSVWKTVNEIVESVFDAEIENPDHTKLSTSKSSNGSSFGSRKRSQSAEKNTKMSAKSENSKALSPELAYSNLKNTIEQSKPKQSDETLHKDGKVEKNLKDGGKIVIFPNGTQKEISSDGHTVKVRFANGDIKEIYSDGSIVYYYEENGTTHTTHPDGLQVLEFPNKQVEHHFPDGTKQITFPDQTVKYLHTDGTEQTVFPDGTEMHVSTNKDKTIVFANGQREIHTGNFKRREYPDGTSKTVFGDGRQETRYASGRLRVKDAHGNVIVDRMAT